VKVVCRVLASLAISWMKIGVLALVDCNKANEIVCHYVNGGIRIEGGLPQVESLIVLWR